MSNSSKTFTQNQFGEKSIGNIFPIGGASGPIGILPSGVQVYAGSGAPSQVAPQGSFYIRNDGSSINQFLYINTDGATGWAAAQLTGTGEVLTGFTPTPGAVAGTDSVLQAIEKLAGNSQNLSILANVLTGFVSGAGSVSAADTILSALEKIDGNANAALPSASFTDIAVTSKTLTGFAAVAGAVTAADTILTGLDKLVGNQALLQNGSFSPTSETISAAGALSTTSMESLVNNATGGSYAVTLAAPSNQDGQLKIIKMGTATHTVTLAMTNIAMSGAYTPLGTTTLTFTNSGDSAVLMAVGSKWVYLGGSAVAS